MSFYKKYKWHGFMAVFKSRATIHESGRVLIPAVFRRALNLSAGEELIIHIENDELILTPVKVSIKKAQEMVKKYNKDNLNLTAELFAMRQSENPS
jgi:AbrB family looped-hinge helix DNA binding protein